MIALTEQENAVLKHFKKKQRERYLMKKFIHWYKIEINISQRDCHQRLNQWLMENDYKPKKSFTSVHDLWHESFVEYVRK